MKKFALIIIIILGIASGCSASTSGSEIDLRSMTLREKVGQLFLIRPDQLNVNLSNDLIHKSKAVGETSVTEIMLDTLRNYPAGGFALFAKNIENPTQLKIFTRELVNACTIQPILAIDEEGGIISRIANHKKFRVKKFPSVKSIGETGNSRMAYDAGAVIGKYLRDYGFNLDFAPIVDVNTNPDNIVIGNRAFGDDPELVSRMAGAFLDGLHSQKIAGSIKHFPGHGDTTNDPHKGYVAISKTWDELLNCELIPFMRNFAKTDSVMVAHITLKNITHDDLPATLSQELITGKLRNELAYDGLIITDAMMMGAVKENYSSSEAAVLAFEAGNDILLMPWDFREAFDGIIHAIETGRISEQRLDESVRRILDFKSKFVF